MPEQGDQGGSVRIFAGIKMRTETEIDNLLLFAHPNSASGISASKNPAIFNIIQWVAGLMG